MRINELKAEYAKSEAVSEYIRHIGYTEFCLDLAHGTFWENLKEFECAITDDGAMFPPGNFVDLGDEIATVMENRDIENLPWVMKLIGIGMNYAAEKGYMVTSVDQLAQVLRRDGMAFEEDDGFIAYIG